MPSPKCQRKGGMDKNNKNKGRILSEKALSFHGRGGGGVAAEILPRPRTVPDLLAAAGRSSGGSEITGRPQKLTKLLMHVTIQRSPGAVHVLLPPEATVEDLIAAAIRQYVKEARRPVLPAAGASGFDLHYSQFSLESLDREEKLMELGSRNFFLCPKEAAAVAGPTGSIGGGACVTTSASKCLKEIDEAMKKGLPLLKLMNFLL